MVWLERTAAWVVTVMCGSAMAQFTPPPPQPRPEPVPQTEPQTEPQADPEPKREDAAPEADPAEEPAPGAAPAEPVERVAPVSDAEFHAQLARRTLAGSTLPFWAETADRFRGGFAPGWSLAAGRERVDEVSTVSQAGLTWVFAHAARHGLAPVELDPWGLTAHGVDFLLGPCRDETHGGFYDWVSLAGGPIRGGDRFVKRTETQSVAIRALVEAYRVNGRDESIAAARETFTRIEEHLRDREHGGWFDEADADWSMGDRERFKRAETHLAVLEAYTALAGVADDEAVSAALAHAVEVCSRRFFPSESGRARQVAAADWSAPPDRLEFGPVVYGLHASAARAIAAGERALGRPVDIAAMRSRLDRALRGVGESSPAGGLPLMGYAGQPPLATTRAWWAQSELAAALAEAIRHEPELSAEYGPGLSGVLVWIATAQTDPQTGVPIAAVDADGRPVWGMLAGPGKFGMIDTRARAAVARLGGAGAW